MSLYGPNILEFKGLKEHARGKEGYEGILAFSDKVDDILTNAWNGSKEIMQLFPQIDKPAACHLAAQKG